MEWTGEQSIDFFQAAISLRSQSPAWMGEDIWYGLLRRGHFPPTSADSSPSPMSDEELEDYIEAAFTQVRKAVLTGKPWLAADLVIGIKRRIPELAAQADAYLIAQARATAWTQTEIDAVRESASRPPQRSLYADLYDQAS